MVQKNPSFISIPSSSAAPNRKIVQICQNLTKRKIAFKIKFILMTLTFITWNRRFKSPYFGAVDRTFNSGIV
jgi:hypothetical protein